VICEWCVGSWGEGLGIHDGKAAREDRMRPLDHGGGEGGME
jgi:hypothetical protein